MKTIYIVEGGTGEYSDRRTWLYKAFKSEKDANKAVKELNLWALKHKVSSQSIEGIDTHYQDEIAKKCPDPNCRIDYTGVDWRVYSCEYQD